MWVVDIDDIKKAFQEIIAEYDLDDKQEEMLADLLARVVREQKQS